MPSAAGEFTEHLLNQALLNDASDIHLEPFEKKFRVRWRTAGGFKNLELDDPRLWSATIRHIKLLGKLDIAQSQTPQDGKFIYNLNGATVEYRVSSLPTTYGESLVLRVLDRNRVPLDIASLGLPPEAEAKLRAAITLPNGLIAIAGPTGSGKTTTLYACVRALSPSRTLKIISVEDPIEYALPGVQQVAVSDALPTSEALRAILRHDPDVIFVGEIRDADTAKLAIQAALTGHLVLTSIHAPNSVGVVSRLIDFGISTTLIATALKFVLAQRLITESGHRHPIAESMLISPPVADAIVAGTALTCFVHDQLPQT